MQVGTPTTSFSYCSYVHNSTTAGKTRGGLHRAGYQWRHPLSPGRILVPSTEYLLATYLGVLGS